MSELSWDPILRGNIYCAPACGRGCTLAEFELADLRGRELAERLGNGWTYVVRENLGWSYKAISACERIKVSGEKDGKRYLALLGEPGCTGGRFSGSGKTPEQAIQSALSSARKSVAFLEGLI